VPQPPSGGGSRLSLGQAHAPQAGPAAPQRSIPIRNLAPPAEKKSSKLVQAAKWTAALVVFAVAAYFGYKFAKSYQDTANAKGQEEERRGGAGQAGHIAELYNVLDATEPGGAGLGSLGKHHGSGPRERPGSSGDIGVPGEDEGFGGMAAAPEKKLPIVAPVWTLDLAASKIPEGRANGSISGTNFVVETARVEQSGTAQILRLMQGQAASPDREVLVYLHLKPGEKLGGQSFAIAADTRIGAPQVTKRWKTDPRYAPQLKSFNTGYVMKLELGQMTNGTLPGKIFLAMPDPEKTVVGGLFRVTPSLFDMDAPATPAAARAVPQPVARPPAQRMGNSRVNDRYGIQ
jgi:hypothetical protein